MNVYKFAEVPVGIEFRGKYFEKKSMEYLADGETPKFCISVNLQDLMYEQEHAEVRSDNHVTDGGRKRIS